VNTCIFIQSPGKSCASWSSLGRKGQGLNHPPAALPSIFMRNCSIIARAKRRGTGDYQHIVECWSGWSGDGQPGSADPPSADEHLPPYRPHRGGRLPEGGDGLRLPRRLLHHPSCAATSAPADRVDQWRKPHSWAAKAQGADPDSQIHTNYGLDIYASPLADRCAPRRGGDPGSGAFRLSPALTPTCHATGVPNVAAHSDFPCSTASSCSRAEPPAGQLNGALLDRIRARPMLPRERLLATTYRPALGRNRGTVRALLAFV